LARKLGSSGKAGSAGLFSKLRDQVGAENADILVHIHGFANTFEDGMTRAAQLKRM